VAVSQKVFELDCVPKLLDPTVSPTQYNSQSVAQLTLSFNPVIPAGTVATMRFLHATTGVLEVQSQMTFDGSSPIIVDGPNDIPDGGATELRSISLMMATILLDMTLCTFRYLPTGTIALRHPIISVYDSRSLVSLRDMLCGLILAAPIRI
jgi:hypothetical protein